MNKTIRVLMCCSDPDSVKGGMVSVIQGYLGYQGFTKSRISFIATHRKGNLLTKSFFFAAAYFKICVLLHRKRVDLVHLHMSERGSFYRKAYLVRACRYFGVPVIIHHHGAEFEDFYGELSEKKKAYVKKILEAADCNIVLSDFLKEQLLKKAQRARVEVLHNAVPVETPQYKKNRKDRIVMLGCQGRRKGSYDLLDALAAIENRLPREITVWMCGDEDVDGVREYAEKRGLSERVAWVGWISGKEKEECLDRMMMHVLPSYREALPMSILETMGRGIPNISTAIASIPEAIEDGKNGYLIQPGDVELLSARILELAENEELRRKFGRESYRTIKEGFSLDKCMEKLESIYERLVK